VNLPNDRTDTYIQSLRQEINQKLQLVVAIFPTSRDDRYAAFKKFCCVESPVPSQVKDNEERISVVKCCGFD